MANEIDLDEKAKPHKRGCAKNFAKLRALVAADVPPATSVGGVPAKILSSDGGSRGYINRQVPPALMAACADPFHG